MLPNIIVDLTQRLGTGGHSAVYLAEDPQTHTPLAVKLFKSGQSGTLLFQNESRLLAALPQGHPTLLKFNGHGEFNKKHFIALEYFAYPSLASFIASKGALPEEQAIAIIRQILDSLNFIFSHGVAHRDLKPDNILIDPDTLQIKLIDFGLGSFVSGLDAQDDFYVGTPIYMCPQLLTKGTTYTISAAEVWSAGITFLELLTGRNPLRGAKTYLEVLEMQPAALKGFDRFGQRAQKLLYGMLAFNEAERLGLKEALALIDLWAARDKIKSARVTSHTRSRSRGSPHVRARSDPESGAYLSVTSS